MNARVLRRLCEIQRDRLADLARPRRLRPIRTERATVQIPVQSMAETVWGVR